MLPAFSCYEIVGFERTGEGGLLRSKENSCSFAEKKLKYNYLCAEKGNVIFDEIYSKNYDITCGIYCIRLVFRKQYG